jgi:hypothetical protein
MIFSGNNEMYFKFENKQLTGLLWPPRPLQLASKSIARFMADNKRLQVGFRVNPY